MGQGMFYLRTLPRKNMNLPHSIRMYWTNFWQLTVHVQQNIFEKTLIKVDSSHLCASFGTFYVQIGKLFESQWDFKLSEEFEIDVIFLRKHFSKTHCDSKNLPIWTKGAKRSAKMWATNFNKSFFKIILLYMNGRLLKIRSVLTYGVR